MTSTTIRSRETAEPQRKRRPTKLTAFPWALVAMAAAPVGLLAYYSTVVAPPKVEVMAGLNVPFPVATEFLVAACRWCGENPAQVALIALGLLAGGIVLPVPAGRYYIALTVTAALALGFTYWSISAPVERLLKQVQENLPVERKLPEFLPGGKTR